MKEINLIALAKSYRESEKREIKRKRKEKREIPAREFTGLANGFNEYKDKRDKRKKIKIEGSKYQKEGLYRIATPVNVLERCS